MAVRFLGDCANVETSEFRLWIETIVDGIRQERNSTKSGEVSLDIQSRGTGVVGSSAVGLRVGKRLPKHRASATQPPPVSILPNRKGLPRNPAYVSTNFTVFEHCLRNRNKFRFVVSRMIRAVYRWLRP